MNSSREKHLMHSVMAHSGIQCLSTITQDGAVHEKGEYKLRMVLPAMIEFIERLIPPLKFCYYYPIASGELFTQ